MKYNSDNSDEVFNIKNQEIPLIKNENNIKIFEEEKNHYINELADENKDEKKYCDKYFSKMNPGSICSSIINTSILTIGIGVLSLPHSVGSVSVFGMVVILILSVPLNFYTIDITINAGREKDLVVYSYIIQEFCGKRWACFFDIIIIISNAGLLIAYQIISKVYYIYNYLSNIYC